MMIDATTALFARQYRFFMRKCDAAPSSIRIKPASLEPFFESGDVEVMGALANFLTYPRCRRSVRPPLEDKRVYTFLLAYWKRCIIENPDSPWALSRYGAALDIHAAWDVFDCEGGLKALVQMLETVYLEGDQAIRVCLETGLFEHFPRDPALRELLLAWKKNPLLRKALEDSFYFKGKR